MGNCYFSFIIQFISLRACGQFFLNSIVVEPSVSQHNTNEGGK